MEKIREMAGAPRTGFHATRIPYLDWALWDTLGTFLAAESMYQLDWFDARGPAYAFCLSLGVIAHVLFQVRTAFIVQLGG